ncbi:MAG: DsrE family protein [Flammeovirgaceae bacterium]|nr:DsrE family protein [Flammeovirgaceae bacterium]
MKTTFTIVLLTFSMIAPAQEKVYPVIKNYGGIYEIPDVDFKANGSTNLKIVIDALSGATNPADLNPAFNNVARMINLHAVAGVPIENLTVAVVIHNQATYAIMDNPSYREKYKTDNPNLALIKELSGAGVQFIVCGQSLIGRDVKREKIAREVKVAVSMLTTVTTLQASGYSLLQF